MCQEFLYTRLFIKEYSLHLYRHFLKIFYFYKKKQNTKTKKTKTFNLYLLDTWYQSPDEFEDRLVVMSGAH